MSDPTNDLRVIAIIPVKSEAVDGLRPALQQLAQATLDEQGCISYDLFESAAAPGTFVTVETWRSQDDLDAHMQSPHVAQALGAAAGSLSGEIAIHPLTPA